MWSYIIIITVSIAVSALAFFSGFGLGTVLLPAFALFFPVPVAIAATAIVHLVNNIFKSVLIGKKANWHVVLKFALPGALAAIIGAFLLNLLSNIPAITMYRIGNSSHEINVIKLVVGALIIFFASLDLIPRFKDTSFNRKYLPLGGAISGFFGGLSGMQGAWRSAFLIKSGLSKEAFIGTVAISSIIVDFSRLLVYGISFYSLKFSTIPKGIYGLVLAASLAAITGSISGTLILKKITMRAIQLVVGIMLIILAAGMISGLI
jgi:uncharacterized protein